MNTQGYAPYSPPRQRSNPDEISRQQISFSQDDLFVELMDVLPAIILILNKNRQVVFGNKAVQDTFQLASRKEILGKRPGEVWNCANYHKNKDGCGTTEFCQYCGAANAIASSQQQGECSAECRILATMNGSEEAFDFRVWAHQFEKKGEPFTFFTVCNIEDEKRRLFLERIFLHDIANTASALLGFSSIVDNQESEESQRSEISKRIHVLAKRIAEEIRAHRQLIAAEYNQLEISPETLDSHEILENMLAMHSDPDIRNGRFLKIDQRAAAVPFASDRTLLTRVLANMIKNGLESSVPGATVTIGCDKVAERIQFWVHNPSYMTKDIRLQIFNRSFSTKGAGRGLGTYSMKYFTEKYLRGNIFFTSDEAEGTRFVVSYPLVIQ